MLYFLLLIFIKTMDDIESSIIKENSENITPEEQKILKDYEFIKSIGKIKNGELFLVLYDLDKSGTKKNYLLKKIEIKSNNGRQQISDEIELLKTIECKYIIKIHNFITEKGNEIEIGYILMDYYEENLETKIKKNSILNNRLIWRIFFQLAYAIKLFHLKKIILKDLCPQNIFIDKKNNIKLGGFGMILDFKNVEDINLFNPYIPPEILNGEDYTNKYDTWSLGCILYELIFKKKPFESIETIKNIKYEISNECENELKMLLSKLLCNDKNRLKINEIFIDMNFKKKLIQINLFDEILGKKISKVRIFQYNFY